MALDRTPDQLPVLKAAVWSTPAVGGSASSWTPRRRPSQVAGRLPPRARSAAEPGEPRCRPLGGRPGLEVMYLLDARTLPSRCCAATGAARRARSSSSAVEGPGTSTSTSPTSVRPSRPASRPAGRTGSRSPRSPPSLPRPRAGRRAPSSRSRAARASPHSSAAGVPVRRGHLRARRRLRAGRPRTRSSPRPPSRWRSCRTTRGCPPIAARAAATRPRAGPGPGSSPPGPRSRASPRSPSATRPGASATTSSPWPRPPRPPGGREVTVAEQEALTSAGRCQPGDVLGSAEGDVVVIGSDPLVSCDLLDRLLSAGGEMATWWSAPTRSSATSCRHVATQHPTIELARYDGGQRRHPPAGRGGVTSWR